MTNTKRITLYILAALLLLACVAIMASAKSASNDYAMTCEVVEIDKDNNLVILVDANGFEWAWEGVEDWQVGDCAALMMNDNGTAEIFDDVILSMTYNAWELSEG